MGSGGDKRGSVAPWRQGTRQGWRQGDMVPYMRQIGSRGPHILGVGLGDLLPLTVESLIGSLSLSEAFKCYMN